jgi:hypothetical protein
MANKWDGRFWADLGDREVASIGSTVIAVLTGAGANVIPNDPKVWWTLVGIPAVVTFLKGVVMNASNGSADQPTSSLVNVTSNKN